MTAKTRSKADSLMQNHNETLVCIPRPAVGFKVKTHVKAGDGPTHNHNATLVQAPRPTSANHNETQVRARAASHR